MVTGELKVPLDSLRPNTNKIKRLDPWSILFQEGLLSVKSA